MKIIPNRALAATLALCFALGPAVAQDKPIRVGANVMQANLVSKVAPVYPEEAKRDGIQGKVSLAITVGKDGHVSDVTVSSGPPELVRSAVDAVQQWVYKPTLLNGQPVVVLTTVDVNFTLSQ